MPGNGGSGDRRVGTTRRRSLIRWNLAILLITAPLAQGQVDTSLRDSLRSEAGRYEALLEQRRADIRAVEARLGETRSELAARVAERDRISARIADLGAEERSLEARIADLEVQRTATAAAIATEEANLAALEDRIRALLVNLHRRRAGQAANVLAGASSLHDLQVRNRFLDLLSRQDVTLVNQLDAQIADLMNLRARLAREAADLASARDALSATRNAQQTARADLEAAIEALDATQVGQEAQRVALLLAQEDLERNLTTITTRLEQEIARLEEEERRLRAAAARAAEDADRREALTAEADRARARIEALTSPQAPNAAGFVGPIEEGQLVSRYGEGNNSFIAIRATRAGAAVYTVQSGVVIAAQSIGANDGYMVAVRHDGTLTTVYTNLREPPVEVGDRVERGQSIGFLGGGTLPPPDVLRLYVRINDEGRESFVDPLPILGL